jgi:hypothetical protein
VGYGEKSPHILGVMDVLLTCDSAPWVRASYVGKLRRYIGTGYEFYVYASDELASLVRILKQLPEGPDIVTEHREAMESRLPELPAAEREILNALLKMTEKDDE